MNKKHPTLPASLESKLTASFSRRRLSPSTRDTYRYWIARYVRYVRDRPQSTSEEKVTTWLSSIAPRSAASTQSQALNAIVFLYKRVLLRPLGKLPSWTAAKRPRRLPTWITHDEALNLFKEARGTAGLVLSVLYGSGLRLNEALTLRIKDVDFEHSTLIVREGKGNKDRVTCLPRMLLQPLRDQIAYARSLYNLDRVDGIKGVDLPADVKRKYPNASTDFAWFWLFPSRERVSAARTNGKGPVRWHIHPETIGRALTRARKRAGIAKKISCHTLRHSFATAMIGAGIHIEQLRELLGHRSIATTQIYLHCLPSVANSITSPLDAPPKIIPFAHASPENALIAGTTTPDAACPPLSNHL